MAKTTDEFDGLGMAWVDRVKKRSKDPSTKTGAVILEKFSGSVISIGYNDLPEGVEDTPERRQRPDKYLFTEHAERNAIFSALKSGYTLGNTIMYTGWYPCADCARAIIQSGIPELVCKEPDWEDKKWGKDFEVSKQMLEESNVKVRFVQNE